MGWDDGAERGGPRGGGDLNAASRQTDPESDFPFHPSAAGPGGAGDGERGGIVIIWPAAPSLAPSRADGGDGLFVRALWLNYDALLRIPRHEASRVRWMALFLEMVASLSAERF